MDNYRDWQSFSPWGVASGESPFDKNDVDREGKPFRPMRAIRGLAANVAINLGIWDLAESLRLLS